MIKEKQKNPVLNLEGRYHSQLFQGEISSEDAITRPLKLLKLGIEIEVQFQAFKN